MFRDRQPTAPPGVPVTVSQFSLFEIADRSAAGPDGLRYQPDFLSAEPIPAWLLPARARAAAFVGLDEDALAQALVIRYGEGAGLGWHRDRPVFDDVLGISLLSTAPLRFRRRRGEKWERFTLRAEPRSLYLLRGPARSEWQHSLAPVAALRYAITFRSMRR